MAEQPFPGFIGPTYTTQSVNAGSQRLVNLYCEVTESAGEPDRVVYYGSPGKSVLSSLPDAPCRTFFYQDNRAFALAGSGYYELFSNGGSVLRGTVASDGQPGSITSNGQLAGHQNFVVSGGNGYIHDLNTNTFTQVTVTGFPKNAVMGAFFDQYFLVLANGEFQISSLSDGTAWDGTDVAQRTSHADKLVSFLVRPPHLFLFGTQGTEVWYDSGAASFPFAPVTGTQINQGVAAIWSPATCDSSVLWLAANQDGDRVVLRADQFQPVRVSTHALETALRACPDVSDFRGYSYQEGGHLFYILSSQANQMTWAYDISVPAEYAWSERASWNSTTGTYGADRAVCHMAAFGQHWVGDTAGNVYQQALGLYDDAGHVLRAMRRSPHVKSMLNRVFVSQFQLDFEPGVGLSTGQGSSPELMLRLSRDGGHTWGSEQWVSAGPQGVFAQRAIWNRLGSGRNLVFEVAMTDPVKRAWQNASIDLTTGTS